MPLEDISRIDSASSETAIIGAILADGSLIHDFSRDVRSEMFSSKSLGSIFQRMCDLASQEVPVDLFGFISAEPELSARIGANRLSNWQQSFVSERDTRWHVERLKEAHIRRTLIKHAERLMERATDVSQTTVDELKSAVEQIAMNMSEPSAIGVGLWGGPEDAANWFSELEYRVEHPETALGVMTGWTDLDNMTLGFQRGDLIIVGGYTSIGKSAFATEATIRSALGGYKTAYFSLEMSRRQIQNRVASNISGLKANDIRSGTLSKNQLSDASAALGVIQRIPICDERGLSADAIAAEMKRYKRTNGLDFVVVDYIQDVKESSESSDNAGSAYARVARKLRKAAKQCDCAVMGLSQLNRESARAEAPTIAMLSGSSGLETAADVIILLHRDKENDPETLHVNVAKNRNGDMGKITMTYELKKQRITSDRDTFRRKT